MTSPASDDKAAGIAAEYANGDKIEDIAKRHRISAQTVRRYVRRMGGKMRLPGRPYPSRNA